MDDALDAAKGISCANPNVLIFVLTPLIHPSCEQSRVVGNRRDIEDKLLAFLLGVSDVNFSHPPF